MIRARTFHVDLMAEYARYRSLSERPFTFVWRNAHTNNNQREGRYATARSTHGLFDVKPRELSESQQRNVSKNIYRNNDKV